jgi:Copper type II ascorbate-dependent monooxygenase, C-terminal domain
MAQARRKEPPMRKLPGFVAFLALLLASACQEGDAGPALAPPEGSSDARAHAGDAAAGSAANATEGTPDAGGSNQSVGPVRDDASASGADAGATPDAAIGVTDAGASDPSLDFPNPFSWSTGEFEVAPGKDRYLCFASTLQEDVVVNAFSSQGQVFVHHLIFSRSTASDKLGFEECDTAFRTGWQPIFITGAGSVKLELPADAGHKLTKGTKLVVQMHLLNTSDAPVKGKVTINMRRSTHASPRPVSSYIFGTAAVRLPPNQMTQLKGDCTLRERVKLLAGFPHMHMLGRALRFEVGTAGNMREVFKRDPYVFDLQTIEPLELELKAGDLTRVTCDYMNTLNQEVTYGESTKNEMCYFIGFAVDRPQQGACLGALPPSL